MPPIQTPYVLAMLICDAIHRDPSTGKHTILGTFSTIGSRVYPAEQPGMSVFIALTDGRGNTPLQLRLVSADEDVSIVSADLQIAFEDPRSVVEVSAELKNVVFPQPGEYRLQLFSEATPLMERRLMATRIGPGQEGGGSDPAL